MNALVTVPASNTEIYRASTDAAELCRGIVVASAMEIQKRKYVKVEGWQAIAIAHGCTGSARDVERVEGGVRAIGEVRRMSDGAVIAEAEGFVGEDEATWFGGETTYWEWGEKRGEKVWKTKTLPKRPDYAIRAMAQTRAISRACRSAFAHVVVMMNEGLSTTPAEEVPLEGFDNEPRQQQQQPPPRSAKAKDEPMDAEFTDVPVEEHGIYIACKAAIDLGQTKADLEQWATDNEASLAKIKADTPDVYKAVLKHWHRRVRELVETPKPAQADDFGIGEDEIPF